MVQGTTAMPAQLNMLIERMQSLPLLADFKPNEANAIDYHKHQGHWLKAHVDDRLALTGGKHCLSRMPLCHLHGAVIMS